MNIHSIDEQRSVWKISELEEILTESEVHIQRTMQASSFPAQQNIEYIALTILQKSLVTMREIICLVCAGLPDGALSLARNLYEQFVITSFFSTKMQDSALQNYIDDYFLSATLSGLKAKQYYLSTNFPNGEDIMSINEELKDTKSQFHSKVSGDYCWAGVSRFIELVELVQEYHKDDPHYHQFLIIQHINYKNACALLHAGALGNMARLGKNDINIIDMGPHPERCGYPLYFAVCSLIGISGVTLQILGIDNKHIVESFNQLAIYYQQADRQYQK